MLPSLSSRVLFSTALFSLCTPVTHASSPLLARAERGGEGHYQGGERHYENENHNNGQHYGEGHYGTEAHYQQQERNIQSFDRGAVEGFGSGYNAGSNNNNNNGNPVYYIPEQLQPGNMPGNQQQPN